MSEPVYDAPLAGGTFTIPLKSVIELTGGDIGLNDYPIYEESYRETLNKKIIDHYYNCEIGMETVDLFRLAMRRKMNEIMPLYNNLYRAKVDELDPFLTHRMKSTSTSTGESENEARTDGSASNESTSTSKSRAVSSELPQTRLAGNEDYATAANDAASESGATGASTEASTTTGSGRQSGTTTDQSEGFSGQSMSSLMLEYRQAFVNIDLEIITELRELFMSVWDNGDEFSPYSTTLPYYYAHGWF